MECSHIGEIPYSDFTERIHEHAARHRIPINAVLELTQRCNLSCNHCYCVLDRLKPEMDFKQICSLLDELSVAGCLWLLITGGEPLLRNDFLDIYIYAKKKGFIISVFTNGTLISPEIISWFKKYPPFVVEITLYGMTSQTYEKVTATLGLFKRCLEGISLLHEANIPFKLKTTITKDNVVELQQIKIFAKKLEVKFRFDTMLHPRLDGNKTPQNFRLSPEKIVNLDAEDEQRSKAWGDLWQRLGPGGRSDRIFFCNAGISSAHIDPYGVLRICDMVRIPAYELGESCSFKQAWQNLAGIFSQQHGPDYKCNGCELANLCDQCPGWSQLENGDYETLSDYLCTITKLRAEKMGIIREKVGGVV